MSLACIYIDLDGLGANWEEYVVANHFPTMTIQQVNQLPERTAVMRAMYVKEPNLFYNLPTIPQFQALIDHVRSCNCKWAILTAAGTDHPHYETVRLDKVRYVSRHFDVPEERIIVAREGGDKPAFASPMSLLIDDFKRNCEAFEKAGGHSLLVEANTYDVEHVKQQIDKFIASTQPVR